MPFLIKPEPVSRVDEKFNCLAPDAPKRQWAYSPAAFLATTSNIGGLERQALTLAVELARRSVDVRFICRPDSELSSLCNDAGLPTYNLKIANSGDLVGAIVLANYLVEHSVGILHVHSRRDFVPAILAVKIASLRMPEQTRLILHVHQVRKPGSGGKMSDFFFNWGADKIFAVSDTVMSKVLSNSTIDSSLVSVLWNGIDCARFPHPKSIVAKTWRKEMRRSWSIDPQANLIGMIGRLDQKGQIFVAENLKALFDCVPNLAIVFIGPEGEQGALAKLTAITAELGVHDRICFPGLISDMPAALAALDLLVHLPTDEAFGLAVAEAMASSLPVIVSNVGGCRELVRDGETGILIRPRNVQDLIAAMSRVFSESEPELRFNLGAAARKSVEIRFSIERQIDHLMWEYDQLTMSNTQRNSVIECR